MLFSHNIMNLKDKVVLITGAGKGIGRETAKVFYNLGAKVAVISRDESDLKSLRDELEANDSSFFTVVGDVSVESVVQSFVLNSYNHFNRIDCLINNAGMRFRKNFLDISYEEWQTVMNVNVGSTMLMSQAVIPYMKAQGGGRIVNIASIVGTLGLPELTAYAASKGAVISLTKALALELADANINVNVIAPGFCKTSYADNFKSKTNLYDFTIERTPMKRWGESKDIANACVYLTSDLSNYVTGEVLNVDGGWSAW